ncbi:hypothetical protein KC19_4G049100 [Ceratodon purpureus]|uniref:Uncharacterized protein n=1 Tax=Ceratodon purpureus TaxID=3225 RepID=A0A8T0I724_CERPU|nr:hypothetical protein KC19_4G049100 [Ceratodon purpureus]
MLGGSCGSVGGIIDIEVADAGAKQVCGVKVFPLLFKLSPSDLKGNEVEEKLEAVGRESDESSWSGGS